MSNGAPGTTESDPPELEDQTMQSLEVPDQFPSPEELIEKGQYLVDCPSWLSFIGEDKRLQYSNHFISRNDKIWELISTEIRYVDLLVVIRDVFLKAFPPRSEESLNLADNLFPHLDDVLECHTRLLFFMLQAHNATPDHITKNLGQCFTKSLTENTMYRLIEAYGALMFVQNSLTDALNKFKANRTVAERLMACERDPRTKRRTITDCYLIIIQRWTKIETLLAGIIPDIIVQDDSTELNDLNASRRAAQTLLLGAQQKLTDLVNADKLRYFADNLKENWVDVDGSGNSKHRTLLEWMKAPAAKLINYDKLAIECRKEGGKPYNIELYGVALKDCFFLLQQDPETGKFSLFRDSNMPPILIWTKHFGYFRDQAGSPLTFIILIDSKNSAPTLTKFVCSTHDEVARWQKIFSEGFDNFGKPEEPEMESMLLEKNTRELEAAEERRKRQEEKLELINQLSSDIFSQWEVRNTVFRALFVDDGLTVSASRSNSGRSANQRSLNGQSDIQQADDEQAKMRNRHARFMKDVMQLASLCGETDGTCLSRSASDAADRRPSSSSTVMPPPTPDGSGNGDFSKKRGDKDGVVFRIKPKSQNRLSNLLRTGSRRRAEGSTTDSVRDYFSTEQQDRSSEVASESSLICFTNPNLLIAEIQELALALMESFDDQYRRCLDLEKDNLRLRTEVEIAGGQASINTKRELECLRSLQKKVEDEQNAWNSFKQREEARLEREDQKLKKLAKTLEEKQEQYEMDSRTLQEQIDLHASRGIDMGRLRGSTSNLHSLEVDRSPNSSLSHNPSSRSEGGSELGERRNAPDRTTGLPPSTKPRTASTEAQHGRHGSYSQNPSGEQYTHQPSPVPPRPPTGLQGTPQNEPQRHGSITNTLGKLPTKLASKTRSSKSLRH
ncbi:hypothetical protein Aperf_G00000030402 [Anoplocephala perfoliata]